MVADRRGHVHREGRRRAEAAAARGARDARERSRRCRRARRGSTTRSKTLEEAHVNTIHGFCAELLRERPVEARVDPLFAVLTEPQAGPALRARVSRLAAGGADRVRLKACAARCGARARRRSAAGDGDGPIDRLRGAGRTLAEWRDFPHPWQRPPFDRARGDRTSASRRCTGSPTLTGVAVCPRATTCSSTRTRSRRLSRQIELEQSFGQVGSRRLGGAARRSDARPRLLAHAQGQRLQVQQDASAHRRCSRARDALFDDAAAVPAGRRRRPRRLPAAGARRRDRALSGAEAGGRRPRFHRSAGARARPDQERTPASARHLQRKFTRIFVDEFQDTDPIQAEILLLARQRRAAGKLFIVGDPKQAIYRFRGTDVGTYWRVRDAARGARRARAAADDELPQRAGDSAIRQRRLRAGDDRRRGRRCRPSTCRWRRVAPADDSQPAIVALPVPKPYGAAGSASLKASAKAIEESLPDAIGAFIAWLIDEKSGWTVARAAGRTAPSGACRCSRATSRCCSGASSASART